MILFCGNTYGQSLAAFTDYRNYFFVFDNGVSHQQEYQPVREHKIGGSYVAYIDNMGKFKAYYDGFVVELERYNTRTFHATRHLLVYQVDQELLVFDNGRIKSLVYYPAFFGVGDSVVAYMDRASNYLTVYYQGKSIPIADGLVSAAAKSMRVGDNIVAFVDSQDKLYVFYRGKIVELIYGAAKFRVSLNTAAYIDAVSGEFEIFHKGNFYEAETFRPRTFKMGDDLVAYVDQSGSFKLFYNGEITTISSFRPDFYKVIDKMVIYSDNGFFKVLYEGTEYLLENYIPQKYYAEHNTLAYLDQFGYLQCFSQGKTLSLSDEPVSEVEVAGNTVSYKIGLNTNKVYHNGKIY